MMMTIRELLSSPLRSPALLFVTAFALLGILDPLPLRAQQRFDDVQIEIKPIQGNVYMLIGAGGNVTVQTGDDGVFVVDTQFAPMAPKILAAIRTLSDKPIRYIVNTHVHGDHSGGNEGLAQASGATIIGHQNVLKVMSASKDGSADDRFRQAKGAWPSETYTDRKTLRFNGEEIELVHIPSAHSTGDTLVHFKGSRVVSGGDIFAITRYPIVDFDGGGRLPGMIAGLNQIVSMAASNGQGRTYIVPGHGRLCDVEDATKYRDMSVALRDRIQDSINRGLTLEQVKAAKPTRDFDPLYGASTGLGATDSFVEDAYLSLSKTR